jgi:hypothetical protein
MTEIDKLVTEKFVAFRERVVDAIQEKHPYVVGMIESFLAGKRNSIGLRVTESGSGVGDYTFELNGIRIVNTETGRLAPLVHHPFLGVIKPCITVERRVIEEAMGNDLFMSDPFRAISQLLPEITVKFLP